MEKVEIQKDKSLDAEALFNISGAGTLIHDYRILSRDYNMFETNYGYLLTLDSPVYQFNIPIYEGSGFISLEKISDTIFNDKCLFRFMSTIIAHARANNLKSIRVLSQIIDPSSDNSVKKELMLLEVGFQMDQNSMKRFIELMKTFNRTEKNLLELLNAPDGEEFWALNRRRWTGFINLIND